MNIPTLTAQEGIRTGSTGPQASPSSFGANPSGLLDGVNQAERALDTVARTTLASKQLTEEREESRWVTTTLESEKQAINTWMADPKNAASERLAEDLQGFVGERIILSKNAAPNERTRNAVEQGLQTFMTRKHEEALGMQERSRLEGAIVDVTDQIAQALKSFRMANLWNPEGAVVDFGESYTAIKAFIDKAFPGKTGSKLHTMLDYEAALGVMAYHPDLASRIISTSTHLDETQRKTLQNALDTATRSKGSKEKYDFDLTRENARIAASSGKAGVKIPLSSYQKFYPDDLGVTEKAEDDLIIEANEAGYSKFSEVKHLQPGKQAQLANQYAKPETKKDAYTGKLINELVSANIKLYNEDKVAFLTKNNPVVTHLRTVLNDTDDEQAKIEALAAYNSQIFSLQGSPPPNATNPDDYLSLPLAEKRVMSVPEAESFNADLNKGSPEEALKALEALSVRYGKYAPYAINDLTTLPASENRLSQTVRILWEHKDAPYFDVMLGVLKQGKALSELDKVGKTELEEQLKDAPIWGQFIQAELSDTFDNAEELTGYKEAVMTIAAAYGTKLGADVAVAKAVNLVVGSTRGFTSVNGEPVRIMRQRPDGTKRSDVDISRIGFQLTQALNKVAVQELDLDQFSAITNYFGTNMTKDSAEALRDIIAMQAFWKGTPDGQGAILYFRDTDTGFPTEVRDRNGRALRLYFDKLESLFAPRYGLRPPDQLNKAGKVVIPRKHLSDDENNWPLQPSFFE